MFKDAKGTVRSPSADLSNDQSSLTLSKSRSRSKGPAKHTPGKPEASKGSKPLGYLHLDSQGELEDPNFFDLTAKSNTLLGMSQLNQTKQKHDAVQAAYGAQNRHQRKKSSSARDKSPDKSSKGDLSVTDKSQKYMRETDRDSNKQFSLNFKNSIYSKINND